MSLPKRDRRGRFVLRGQSIWLCGGSDGLAPLEGTVVRSGWVVGEGDGLFGDGKVWVTRFALRHGEGQGLPSYHHIWPLSYHPSCKML